MGNEGGRKCSYTFKIYIYFIRVCLCFIIVVDVNSTCTIRPPPGVKWNRVEMLGVSISDGDTGKITELLFVPQCLSVVAELLTTANNYSRPSLPTALCRRV